MSSRGAGTDTARGYDRCVELHVCYGTFGTPERHPCKKAHAALIWAGYEPRVVCTGGCYRTDPLWKGRRKIKRLTGTYKVPTLFLDDGTIIDGTANIVAWAEQHRADSG
jgi:Glutathione S-transferase, N-terminal domain